MIEQFRQGVIGHAGGAVVQGQAPVVAVAAQGKVHLAALVGVLEAVLQQVVQQLAQAHRVAVDPRRAQVGAQAHTAAAERRAHRVHGVLAERVQIQRGEVVAQVAGVGQGQVMQVVDQMGELAHLGFQRGDGLVVERPHAVDHRFQLALQHRQRRAQLVGDVRKPALAGFLALVQALAQAVHMADQIPQLVAAPAAQPGLVVALAQLAGVGAECRYRRHQVARQQPGHQQRQGQAHQSHPAGEIELALLEAPVKLVADRFLVGVGQPAHQIVVGADRHQAAELLRRRRADQRAPVRRQQSQMAGRVAAVPLARLGVGVAVAGQPVEPAQHPRVAEQEVPAAPLRVQHAEVVGQALHLGLLALVDVLAQALLERKEIETAGGHDQHHEGAEKGEEKLVAYAHGRPADLARITEPPV